MIVNFCRDGLLNAAAVNEARVINKDNAMTMTYGFNFREMRIVCSEFSRVIIE